MYARFVYTATTSIACALVGEVIIMYMGYSIEFQVYTAGRERWGKHKGVNSTRQGKGGGTHHLP